MSNFFDELYSFPKNFLPFCAIHNIIGYRSDTCLSLIHVLVRASKRNRTNRRYIYISQFAEAEKPQDL